MSDKPASRPIAKALTHPSGEGYAGQFALPGLFPGYVRQDNEIVRFADEEAARVAALTRLFNVLTSRMVDERTASGYRRMTGAELSVALRETGMTPTLFAEVYGVPQARVIKWIDGEADIPHSAHVLARLLADEGNFKQAMALTLQVQDKGGKDGRPREK